MATSRKTKLTNLIGSEFSGRIKNLDQDSVVQLLNIVQKPMVHTGIINRADPQLILRTPVGNTILTPDMTNVSQFFLNNQQFDVVDHSLAGANALTGSADQVNFMLGDPIAKQASGRNNRAKASRQYAPYQDLTAQLSYEELENSHLTYENLPRDLTGLLSAGRNGGANTMVSPSDVLDELSANSIDEADLAHFLIYDSQYKDTIISQLNSLDVPEEAVEYHFDTIQADDSFIGQLMQRLNVEEAQYDRESGALKIGDRLITNLPDVDENGVFHNSRGSRDIAYIPYKIGYFAEADPTNPNESRIDRLRVQDPVENALDAVVLHYENSKGDVKFKTILDVTRNLPDFSKHPYSEEILDTLKNKVVLSSDIAELNSLLNDYQNKTDDLGAVATMILDEDAKGIIDPLGTSNGSNMGRNLYLAEGVTINADGSLNRSDKEYSKVGQVLSDFHIDRDNFNRNQMSFNAFLTSTDVHPVHVAYAEMALWNSEDAAVATKHGAQTMFDDEKMTGDKIMDMHGNKSTLALIADNDMSIEEAKEKHLEYPVQMAKDNPDLDLIVSPISINSRLNMGVPHEALASDEKQDLHLPDGSTVKNGITKMMYMSLPQTAEHKSKDYSKEGNGRRYSTLLHYALASKVREDLYQKALVSPEVRQDHIDEINRTFNRLGVEFDDPNALIKEGNVRAEVTSEAWIDADQLAMMPPSVFRSNIMAHMENGAINISLGDMYVTSPLTNQPIVDDFGENVLPIRVDKDESIPFRYMDVFDAISTHNQDRLNATYNANIASVDFNRLTEKDNLLKNIDTMSFTKDARTDVLLPDPRLALDEVRSQVADDKVIIHRDPAIRSGNVMSVKNVGDGADNTISVNPLIEEMMNADNDGDTLGNVGYSNVHLDEAGKQEFYDKSSVIEQLNQYGRVFLGTGSSHFKAATLVNGIDDSPISFDDKKSNEELAKVVNDINRQIVDSPKSYGAYALELTSPEHVKNSLKKLANDGIKGNEADIDTIFDKGYTPDENKAVLKALIAKSEWTGLAGAITNNLISEIHGAEFDQDLVRNAMDVTHSMTQSVLQMKKDASKLPIIDEKIKDMKAVMAGKLDIANSREKLLNATEGLIEPQAINEFVARVAIRQEPDADFGHGVINHKDLTTTKMAYASDDQFAKNVMNLAKHHDDHQIDQTDDRQQLADAMADLSSLDVESRLKF